MKTPEGLPQKVDALPSETALRYGYETFILH